MNHSLKTLPKYFQRVKDREKTFEIRKNDRDFQVGDEVELVYYNPEDEREYNEPIYLEITYVFNGGQYGIDPEYCVFGFKIIEQ